MRADASRRCKKCAGKRVTKEKKKVSFDIQPGTIDGQRIALKGEGDEAVSPEKSACQETSY